MVGVPANIIEVVVLAAGADAFLGVGGAGVGRGDDAGPAGDVGFALVEENGDELVHAGIGEQEAGRVGHERRGRHDSVLLLREEIEKRLADLGGGHG